MNNSLVKGSFYESKSMHIVEYRSSLFHGAIKTVWIRIIPFAEQNKVAGTVDTASDTFFYIILVHYN